MNAKTDRTKASVLIGLGSNIQPEKNIKQALALLNAKTRLIGTSSIWQSKAVGSSGPDFLNAAVLIETHYSLQELRDRILSEIENALGRVRSADKFMDRTIDLDVILYQGQVIDAELWTQAHIALPSSQLVPGLINPSTGERLIDLSQKLASETNPAPIERKDLEGKSH